jgi:RimJ/RimL family protein N-acetyltransferase
VIAYGFESCGLNRIWAGRFGRNPASGRVLEKAGLKLEGVLRQHFVKWGEAQDVYRYGILRSEWGS